MAALVHGPEQRLGEEGAADPGGDADVAGAEADREGVGGHVLATLLEIEAVGGDDLHAEVELRRLRPVAVKDRVVDGVLAAPDLAHQRHDHFPQPAEQRLQLTGGDARLQAVQEGVVRALVVTERVGDPAVDVDVAVEVGRKELPIRGLARLLPDRSGLAGGARRLGDQLSGDLDRLVVVAARDPDQCALVRLGIEVASLQLLQQPADLGVDQALVGELAEGGHGRGAGGHATGGHVGFLVPGQHRRGPVEAGDLVEDLPEPVERCVAHAVNSKQCQGGCKARLRRAV